MISLSQRDASRTECARVSIETQERPDISVQEVDQATISAGEGNLIVKVKVMPLAVHFREFIGRGVFLPQQRPSQLLSSLVCDVLCSQSTRSHFQRFADLKKFGEFFCCQCSNGRAAIVMANHQI